MYFTSSFQPRIPSDVLIGILESLYTIAPTTLRGLRVVSKQFDALIVPFAYRHVVLNKKILAWFSVRFGGMVVNGRHPTWVEWHGLRDMRRYTEHVTIDRDLNEVATIYLLRSLRRLEYIT